MAEKVLLVQSAPGAATLTDAYQAETGGITVLNSVSVCNRSSTPTDFRIAVTPDGGAVADQNYLAYGIRLPGNETYGREFGLALPPGAIVRVYATLATVSFSLSMLRRA